jgi:hypothetical protein
VASERLFGSHKAGCHDLEARNGGLNPAPGSVVVAFILGMFLLSYIHSRRMRPFVLAVLLIAVVVFAIEGRSGLLIFGALVVLCALCLSEAWSKLMHRSDELTGRREKAP